jgi:hypothetical protein
VCNRASGGLPRVFPRQSIANIRINFLKVQKNQKHAHQTQRAAARKMEKDFKELQSVEIINGKLRKVYTRKKLGL